MREPLEWFRERAGYKWWVVGTVCLGAFMGQLDASIATLLIPTLRTVFRQHLANVEWVVISYLLTLVGLVVMFGRLADMFGRKEMYTLGFVVFTAGSVVCGASGTLEALVLWRVVQALGAAMLQANSVAIITQAVDRSELGQAIGVQGAAQAIGLSVGPALGGILISQLGWQWVFYINLPVGIVGTTAGWLILPSSERAGPGESFDWLGLALFAPATAMSVYAITQGERWGWGSPEIIGLIVLSLMLFALFAVRERRAAFPMVHLELFANRTFTAGVVAGLLSYAVLFGGLFVIPVFLERALRLSAQTTGLTLTAVPVALAVAAPFAGALADRFGPRGLTVGGMVVAAVALLWLDKVSPTAELSLLSALALFGLGVGAFTPPNNAAIMGAAPLKRLGVAGGILNMTRGLGATWGVAATGAVLAWRQRVYEAGWRPGDVASFARHLAGVHHHRLIVAMYSVSRAFHDSVLFLFALALLGGAISMVRGRASIAGEFEEGHQELL